MKGLEEVFVEGSVKESWMGPGREGEIEGNWRKPVRKRRKKVKAIMIVMVIVLKGLGGCGITSMLVEGRFGLVWFGLGVLCLCFREIK